jgi:membrane glycosyltransferase
MIVSRGMKAIVGSVTVAILSFILMKVMYVIDPVTSDTGLLTALVFIFVNVPLWIMSGLVAIYGVFVMMKEKKKVSSSNHEEITQLEEINEEAEK